MKLFTCTSPLELGQKAADHTIALMNTGGLVCTASGDSPRPVYHALAAQLGGKQPEWDFIGLDEWLDMNGEDTGSCRNYLDRDLFQPLHIDKNRICFFDGKGDVYEECKRSDEYIDAHGKIRLSILGVGLNGHIGMNEPGSELSWRSHQAELDPLTQQTGQKYFTGPTALRGGITLGLKDLLHSETVFLVVTGAHKADILKKILHEPPSNNIPATLLRNHPHCFIYADAAATSKL